MEPGAPARSVPSGFGLCLEREQEFAPLRAPVILWLGSKSAPRAQEICCLALACLFSLLLATLLLEPELLEALVQQHPSFWRG